MFYNCTSVPYPFMNSELQLSEYPFGEELSITICFRLPNFFVVCSEQKLVTQGHSTSAHNVDSADTLMTGRFMNSASLSMSMSMSLLVNNIGVRPICMPMLNWSWSAGSSPSRLGNQALAWPKQAYFCYRLLLLRFLSSLCLLYMLVYHIIHLHARSSQRETLTGLLPNVSKELMLLKECRTKKKMSEPSSKW